MGLKILEIESDQNLQDLILTVHHCYMHALMNTPAIKIIENHAGANLTKQHAPSSPNTTLPKQGGGGPPFNSE